MLARIWLLLAPGNWASAYMYIHVAPFAVFSHGLNINQHNSECLWFCWCYLPHMVPTQLKSHCICEFGLHTFTFWYSPRVMAIENAHMQDQTRQAPVSQRVAIIVQLMINRSSMSNCVLRKLAINRNSLWNGASSEEVCVTTWLLQHTCMENALTSTCMISLLWYYSDCLPRVGLCCVWVSHGYRWSSLRIWSLPTTR